MLNQDLFVGSRAIFLYTFSDCNYQLKNVIIGYTLNVIQDSRNDVNLLLLHPSTVHSAST